MILGDSGSSGGDMVKIDGQFNNLTMLRAIVFDRSFFRSLLFAALIVQIVSSDLVVEIF